MKYVRNMFKVNNKTTKTRSVAWSGIFVVEIWRRFLITWQGRIFFLSNFVLEILLTIGSHFFPAGIYLLKVNNRNIRTRCEICSKLTIKIPEHIFGIPQGSE